MGLTNFCVFCLLLINVKHMFVKIILSATVFSLLSSYFVSHSYAVRNESTIEYFEYPPETILFFFFCYINISRETVIYWSEDSATQSSYKSLFLDTMRVPFFFIFICNIYSTFLFLIQLS